MGHLGGKVLIKLNISKTWLRGGASWKRIHLKKEAVDSITVVSSHLLNSYCVPAMAVRASGERGIYVKRKKLSL